ncbi:hypothetical protein BH11ACT8_BH11ACT8_04120 [soil metagenome]
MARDLGGHTTGEVGDYARARWNDLVRTLVVLGCEPVEAEAGAREALVRSWREWPDEDRAGDVDVLVYGRLLRVWHWPEQHPAVAPAQVALVLMAGARLDDYQAGRLAGTQDALPPVQLWQGEDWDDRYRGTAPVDGIVAEVRARRRRRLRRGGAVLTALVVVAAALSLRGGAEPEPDPPEVTANPLPIAWWTDGTLHLARTEVEMPGLLSLAQAGTGTSYSVVLGDDRGQVVQVDADGTSRRIGTSFVGVPVRADTDGRAAWVDLDGETPTVLVWDTGAGQVVAQLPLEARAGRRTQVVALDGDMVYLRSPTGTSAWSLDSVAAVPVPERVLDVADGARLSSVSSTGALTGSRRPGEAGSGSFSVGSGTRGVLSHDGLLAAAWVPQEAGLTITGADPTPVLDLPSGSRVLEARFAPDGTLVVATSRIYLLARNYDDGSSLSGRTPFVDLVTCMTSTGACTVAKGRDTFASPTGQAPVVLAD